VDGSADRLASSGRVKLKNDGVNISDWLQNLATFTGHVCRRYSGMEINAIAQYLVNQLKNRESYDLLVLKELVSIMTVRVAAHAWADRPAAPAAVKHSADQASLGCDPVYGHSYRTGRPIVLIVDRWHPVDS
jgi:hypothetical protein